MSVRVRYAPSPTGLQHIGSMRTALFDYLFARNQGGSFIVRLEDTDRTRSDDKYVKNLYDTFKWLGFYWDEGPDVGGEYGPYIQSERSALYKRHAEELVEKGEAYYCFCGDESKAAADPEESEAEAESKGFGYARTCRNLDPAEARARAAAGAAHVIRLKIPLDGTTAFDDLIMGRIEWRNADVNPDPVLLKSDGFPTYHLANVVDDHYMKISHVIRAQEWIPSAPLHAIMYRAFGWEMPHICHVPMVLGEDGHKLSKRHGSTSIDEFRTGGYLREALINYVAMLGCSYEEGRDILSLEELAERFRLEKINKAPAIFDYKKLEWFNGMYIRLKDDRELLDLVLPFCVEDGLVGAELAPELEGKLLRCMPLIRERLKFLTEAPSMLAYLFAAPALPAREEFLPKKLDVAQTADILEATLSTLCACDFADHAKAEEFFRAWSTGRGNKLGDVLMPLRVAVTGTRVSPPLFESIAIIGVEETARRIANSVAYLRRGNA